VFLAQGSGKAIPLARDVSLPLAGSSCATAAGILDIRQRDCKALGRFVLEAAIRRGDTMHEFQEGEEAKVIRRGAEVELMVFRQIGDFVYVFDKENRGYQYHVRDVKPATTLYTDAHEKVMSAAPTCGVNVN
jgi:hypothetical protein